MSSVVSSVGNVAWLVPCACGCEQCLGPVMVRGVSPVRFHVPIPCLLCCLVVVDGAAQSLVSWLSQFGRAPRLCGSPDPPCCIRLICCGFDVIACPRQSPCHVLVLITWIRRLRSPGSPSMLLRCALEAIFDPGSGPSIPTNDGRDFWECVVCLVSHHAPLKSSDIALGVYVCSRKRVGQSAKSHLFSRTNMYVNASILLSTNTHSQSTRGIFTGGAYSCVHPHEFHPELLSFGLGGRSVQLPRL